jgi:predicted O-methyltransferase YrrM
MDFLPENISQFTEAHSQKESEVLYELNRQTHLKMTLPRMLSGHLQGRVLSMLSKIHQPKKVLEIGTFTGYAALCMAEGLAEGGKVLTLDKNEELESMVHEYIDKAGYQDKIEFRVGNAMEIIPELDNDWDMVFIDADKENYLNYYKLVIDKVRPGGLILADNVLWSGKVTEDYESLDEETRVLVDYCKYTHEDDRVENVLFPIRDGLMVSRKK